MPVFNARLHKVTLAKGRFSRKFFAEVNGEMRKAARAFVQVAAASIPVRTGFARGTLRNITQITDTFRQGAQPSGDVFEVLSNLKQEFRQARAPKQKERLQRQFPEAAKLFKGFNAGQLRRAAKEFKGGSLGIPLEYYRTGAGKVLKTPQSGRQFATPSDKIFSFSPEGVFKFNFRVSISYLSINDAFANSRNKGTPWKAFERGAAFFMHYLRTVAIRKLPRVQDYIVKSAVTVRGTSIIETPSEIVERGRIINLG